MFYTRTRALEFVSKNNMLNIYADGKKFKFKDHKNE